MRLISMKINTFLFVLLAFQMLQIDKVNADFYSDAYARCPSSTAQDISYLENTLVNYLKPLGYELKLDSLNISDYVAMLGAPSPFILRTPFYSIRSVQFVVKNESTSKVFHGSIDLLCYKEPEQKLNSTSQSYEPLYMPKKKFQLALVGGLTDDYFNLEISPDYFNLNEQK